MYQPFNPAECALIVHTIMVDEELDRSHPERHIRFHAIDRPGIVSRIRRTASRGLIAVGSRLDPTVVAPATAASGPRA